MDLTDIEQIIIIDDICDGGRTFIELAKVIKEQTDKPIYLVVTHGIFSGGFEKLSDVLDGIFCTNSVKNINFETVKVQSRQNSSDFVKQLNIF
jgi:ribose-phosphate pyrophosphokinase